MAENWQQINPQVNPEAEFSEIVNDFGNPLELLREAISNSIDAGASWIEIKFSVREIDGAPKSVITIADNGSGMTEDVIKRDFWGLGYSSSRERKVNSTESVIGEKGHGTKIYLRSENVRVYTQNKHGALNSECARPLANLSQKKMHEPKWQSTKKLWDHTGTEVEIIGYNGNERSKFIKDVVKDYILWFTKVGSIEKVFDQKQFENFSVKLMCLDQDDIEVISFGHIFPDENSNIEKLFKDQGAAAADLYVKRHVWKRQRLPDHPEVTYDVVISVEGDQVKRDYNPMIRERLRSDTGRYRVSDRYGLWLCKDFIPVARVNDWISGFGSGSNAFVLLHAFVNCQALKLTANRGDIANTDPIILEEIKSEVQKLIESVDKELNNNGLYTLREWQEEDRTLKQERDEFSRRIKNLSNRKTAKFDGRTILEPQNEAELFGLFITVYTLYPDLFEFEPLDYSTSRGVDLIARNKGYNFITEGENWYIELKHTLQKKRFNHAFEHLRWIICWDFDKTIAPGVELVGVEDTDRRILKKELDDKGSLVYFLDNPRKPHKIQVVQLKELLAQKFNVRFETQR